MNKRDVSPPGREEQVKALKGKVDNPYAVAWASYNKSDDHDDVSPADFESVLSAVAVPQKGHTGESYTYGQKRGTEAPDAPYNEIAKEGGPYEEADSMDEARAMFGDSIEMLEEGHASEPVAGSDSLRGHPKYGTDDDDLYDAMDLETFAARNKDDAGMSAPDDQATQAENASEASEESEEDDDLSFLSQPMPSEPVSAKPVGTSSGPIANPQLEGSV